MKFITSLIVLFMAFNVRAQTEKFGLGVMLGNPSGLNGKYWLENGHAIDGGLGLSFGRQTNGSVHSDYLFHKIESFYYNDVHPLDLHFGVGARMEFADSIELGIRLPVGFSHTVVDKNADIFAEVAPIIDFMTRVGLELHFAFGARFYFN